MNGTLANALLVGFFLVLGGFFSGSETALVSLREGQVKALAQRGRRGEKVAALARRPQPLPRGRPGRGHPGRVPVRGVRCLGVRRRPRAGAAWLGPVRRPGDQTGDKDAAYWLAFVIVTLVITYLALVISELTPKRLALQRAEGISLAAAPTLDRLARVSRPVIWLLSRSTDLVVRLLGGDPTAGRETISEEELRGIVAGHESLGREERQLIEDVFEAGDRQLHEVMVPRTEVDFLDATTPVYKAVKMSSTNPHSRYPVVRGSHDEVVGFVHVRDLFAPEVSRRAGPGR